MRFLELLIPQKDSRYVLHVEEKCGMEVLIETLKREYGFLDKRSLLYHVRTGRFLGEEGTVGEWGIESGDTLMFFGTPAVKEERAWKQ